MGKQFNWKLDSTRHIALACILFTNFLFAWKYSDRHFSGALYLSLTYTVLLALFFFFFNKDSLKVPKGINLAKYYLLPLIAVSAFIFYKLDPLSIKVDRWSVITSFWDAAFAGAYPYFAKSHMGAPPGPLPVYYLIGLPFYLLGEIGWYAVLGLILFVEFAKRKIKGIKSKTLILFTLASFAIIYEILVRSTIFTNSAIFLIFLTWIKDYPYPNGNIKKIIWIGLLAGVLLSTRMVYGLCFAIYFIHGLRSKQLTWKNAFIWGFASLAGFILTLLPIYLAFPNDFWVQNPFNIQGTYSMEPFWQPIFLIMAIAMGWFCKENNKLNFMYGFILFSIIFIYVVYHLFLLGSEGIWDGSIDISYLIFSFPFLLYHLFEKETTNSSQA